MKEIEIKVQIESSKELEKFLRLSAKLIKEERQLDEYFSPKSQSYLDERPVKQWLRLRDENGQYSITYKKWHYRNGQSNYCDEYETKLSDFKQMKMLLRALNFETIITVDKKRRSYIYEDYEVSLDTVKNLGSFVEIEYIGRKKIEPAKATAKMMKFLELFNVGKIVRNHQGYPKLLLDKR